MRRYVDRAAAGAVGSINGGSGRDVALTFDDGPDAVETARILERLEQHDASATFFFLVERAEAQPQVARLVVEAGHEVGLHGIDHTRLTTLSPDDARAALVAGKARLEAVLGRPVRWFRPAFGAQNLTTYRAAHRAGLDVVVWDAEGADWVDGTTDEVVARTLANVRPGGIVLLHDRLEPGGFDVEAPATSFDRAEVADHLIHGLAQRGIRCCTVSELVRDGARRTAWFRP